MQLPLPGGGTEPLGARIVELPRDPGRALRRDPYSGFVAYVPVGSLEKGRRLVTTGDGKVQPCTACHGPELTGMSQVPGVAGEVPGIAGDSPLYLARQLYGFQSGGRSGPDAAMMLPVVAALSDEDYVDAAAYLASLPAGGSAGKGH